MKEVIFVYFMLIALVFGLLALGLYSPASRLEIFGEYYCTEIKGVGFQKSEKDCYLIKESK